MSPDSAGPMVGADGGKDTSNRGRESPMPLRDIAGDDLTTAVSNDPSLIQLTGPALCRVSRSV